MKSQSSFRRIAAHLIVVNGIRMVRWERVYQVFRSSDSMSVLCTAREDVARAEYAKPTNAVMVVSDEYRALCLPDLGHTMRIVVAEERKAAAA